jgi:hypothetical protein
VLRSLSLSFGRGYGRSGPYPLRFILIDCATLMYRVVHFDYYKSGCVSLDTPLPRPNRLVSFQTHIPIYQNCGFVPILSRNPVRRQLSVCTERYTLGFPSRETPSNVVSRYILVWAYIWIGFAQHSKLCIYGLLAGDSSYYSENPVLRGLMNVWFLAYMKKAADSFGTGFAIP